MRESSKGKLLWDIFIILLAVYNCFSIPFILAFRPAYAETTANEVFETLIDLIFFGDIILNFMTTYIDKKSGEEVYNSRKIVFHYLQTMKFYLDLFSTIPFDKIFGSLVTNDGK